MPTMPQKFTPVVSGYSHGGPNGVIRTPVAGGAARYSLDWERGTQEFQVTLVLDKLQYAVWIAFFIYEIKKGALAFDMQLDSGFGLAAHSCNIVPGSYSLSHTDGTHVSVVFRVEALSGAYGLDQSEVDDFGLSADSLPTGLRPIVSGYSHDGPDGVIRDDVPGGVSSYAQALAGGLQRFNCTLVLTALQYRTWAVWFHRLIAKGAYTFSMPLDSGYGVTPHSVNIIPGSYSTVRNGAITLVSFAVEGESEVYELGREGAEALLDMYAEYGQGLTALFARIEQFANVDTLVLDF